MLLFFHTQLKATQMADSARSVIKISYKCQCNLTGYNEEIIFIFSTLPDDIKKIEVYLQSQFVTPNCRKWLSHTICSIDEDELRRSYPWINLYNYPPPSIFSEADDEFIQEFKESYLRLMVENIHKGIAFESHLSKNFDSFVFKLHDLTLHKLTPWNCWQSKRNRKLLLDANCLQLIMEIYDCLLKKPYNERSANEKLLESEILLFIWNFSETPFESLEIIKLNGLNLVMNSFHNSTEDYDVHGVLDHIAGVIARFVSNLHQHYCN